MHLDEPKTYAKARVGPDSKKWLEDIKFEM